VAGGLDWVLLCLRLGLSAVFVVAATAKLADRGAARDTLERFGVPAGLIRPGTILLPAAELAIAALLVPASTARAGAGAAAGLLLVFSAVLARVAARGASAGCNCFGTLTATRPLGALARNAVFGAAAAAVVAGGAGQALGDLSTAGLLTVIFAVVAGAQAWLSWQLLHRNMQLAAELSAGAAARPTPGPGQLEVGDEAPAFALADASGEIHTLYDLLADGLPLALVFSDPDCRACETLPERLAQLDEALAGELELALVTRGPAAPGPFSPVLLQREHEVTHAYGATRVPSAVLISPDGRITSALATGDLAVEELLTRELIEAVT